MSKMQRFGDSVPGCGLCTTAPGTRRRPDHGISATFSIVAVDPETGICGAAVASKYPAVGAVVPYVRGGVGAFCTQHYAPSRRLGPASARNARSRASRRAKCWPSCVRDDDRPGTRQLAIIDRHGRTAQHNPIDADPAQPLVGRDERAILRLPGQHARRQRSDHRDGRRV